MGKKDKGAKRPKDDDLKAIKAKVAEKRAKREKEAAQAAAGVTYEKAPKEKKGKKKPALEVSEPEAFPEVIDPEVNEASLREEAVAALNLKAAALRETIADERTKKKARWAAETDLDKVLGELRDLGAPFAHIAAAAGEKTPRVGDDLPFLPVTPLLEEARAAEAETINQPSPPVEEEDPVPRDHLKRPLLFVPGTDKPQGHTRVTTFVGAIEDQEGITRWKGQRIVEGFGNDMYRGTEDTGLVEGAAQHVDEYHQAFAEADRKLAEDEVTLAEYRELVDAAEATLKKALDEIREEAFVLGGGEKKADAGTRLHALTELVDRGEDLPDDVTASELADLDAYKRECDRVGLKFKHIELFVANAEHKTAGTLDRLALYKPEGAQRAKTVVADIKTGKIEYPGKIAGQIAEYAGSEIVDLETIRDPESKRAKLGAVQDIGLVIHLPAGRGECTIYEIDLAFGRRWNKLCAEVRSIRNESKRKGVVLTPVS
jgi:hypothetical protein